MKVFEFLRVQGYKYGFTEHFKKNLSFSKLGLGKLAF